MAAAGTGLKIPSTISRIGKIRRYARGVLLGLGAAAATNPLRDTVLARLRGINPVIAEVAILEVQAPSFDSPKRALLAWGVRQDHQFHGDFRGELFVILVVNDSLTRVLRVLDTIPTPRWLDYDMRLDRVTADSILVVGKGATYGNRPMPRAYAW